MSHGVEPALPFILLNVSQYLPVGLLQRTDKRDKVLGTQHDILLAEKLWWHDP